MSSLGILLHIAHFTIRHAPIYLVDQLSFLPLLHCLTSYPCLFPLPLLRVQPYLVKLLSTINFYLFFEYVQQAENESVYCISYPRDVMCDVAAVPLTSIVTRDFTILE